MKRPIYHKRERTASKFTTIMNQPMLAPCFGERMDEGPDCLSKAEATKLLMDVFSWYVDKHAGTDPIDDALKNGRRFAENVLTVAEKMHPNHHGIMAVLQADF